MTEKPTKPATKPKSARKPKTTRHEPNHSDISKRAYYIHVEEGEHDALGNWLRAERELTAA